MTAAFAGCDSCTEYALRRLGVIFPAIKRVAGKHHVNAAYLAALFFTAVHARHLSGKAL